MLQAISQLAGPVFSNKHRSLVTFPQQINRLERNRLLRLGAHNDFNKRHEMRWVPKMSRYHTFREAGFGCNRSDTKPGSIAGQDSMPARDAVQIAEEFVFQIEILGNGLKDPSRRL